MWEVWLKIIIIKKNCSPDYSWNFSFLNSFLNPVKWSFSSKPIYVSVCGCVSIYHSGKKEIKKKTIYVNIRPSIPNQKMVGRKPVWAEIKSCMRCLLNPWKWVMQDASLPNPRFKFGFYHLSTEIRLFWDWIPKLQFWVSYLA